MMNQRYERIRELEFAGLFKRLPPATVGSIVTRECNRIMARIHGIDVGNNNNCRRLAAGE